jgi:chromosome segregation ATPase
MSYLPGGEPATKTDLTAVDSRVTLRMDKLEQRMDKLEQRMEKLEERMDRLEQRMDRLEQSMEHLRDSMLNLSNDFHSALRSQTRTFILSSLGSTVTLAGAIIGAAAVFL